MKTLESNTVTLDDYKFIDAVTQQLQNLMLPNATVAKPMINRFSNPNCLQTWKPRITATDKYDFVILITTLGFSAAIP